MRIKLKFLLLIPLMFSLVNCSSGDKITFQSGDDTFTTYFNDSYFDLPNDEYHGEIALASHAMALATFNGDKDYTKRSSYLRDLWEKEGFQNIRMNSWFYLEPSTDSIGYGIASKEIQLFGGKYTLIAVAVRGGNYEAEWTSNVTVGLSGNSQGFDEASNMVVEGIANYIEKIKIEGHIKIWISGFSRAAITSNLAAGKILNNMVNHELLSDNVRYDKRDIYAYCFEPPLGVYEDLDVARGDLYQGIHNFINYNDLVPLVCPFGWGFVRYGTDHYYPDRLNDIYFDYSEREKLVSDYHFTYGAHNFPKYSVDDWQFFDVGGEYAETNNLPRVTLHPSQGRFSRTLINKIIANQYITRSVYALLMQPGIRNIMSTVFGKNEDIPGIDTSKVIDIIFEYSFMKTLINDLENNQVTDFVYDIEMLFLQLFGANDTNIDQVRNLYYNNLFTFIYIANGFVDHQDITAQCLYRNNAMNIVFGHTPQLSYSFLCSCDHRLRGDSACKFNDGSYKILHIDDPQSFELYEKNLHKIVFKLDDDGMKSDCLSAERFNDYSINVYLPNNGSYEYYGDFDNIKLSMLDPLGIETPILNTSDKQGIIN